MMMQDVEERPEAAEMAATEEALYVNKNYNSEQNERRKQYRARQRMPNWLMKEECVISGISGRFPESDNVLEFERNLYENIDMVVEDERRWPFEEKDAHLMDSQVRIMLEITFEALWDAGLDPASLAGSKTGVFLGNCFNEYMTAYSKDYLNVPAYRQCFYAMLSNVFDFRGPCKHFETACASGFSAFHEAMVSMRNGQCERAIVVGLNVCLCASTQNQFFQLNMISPDGHCKCLDDDANGYAKGEACVAIVLQRKSEAKRIYATVVHTKSNCDGYKDLGITFPSFELQRDLMEDTHHEAEIDPLDIGFCEAHCTGTQAGDPSEMRAIYEAMCKDRKEPLLIGAVKSVIGHSEASSGLCALVKSLLCFKNEMIPPNLHMQKMNHRIESLMSGILKPVTSNTPYHGKYIALNCFGFGGVNIHAIIRKHDFKQNSEEPEFDTSRTLPRLVTFCGRNQETIDEIFAFIQQNPDKMTSAFFSLLNDISKTSPYPNRMFKGMRHRAFALLDKCDEQTVFTPISELKSGKIKHKVKPAICFIFTGMGCQWAAMGEKLCQFETIKSSFEACNAQLRKIQPEFDLMLIITDPRGDALKTPLNSFVAIAAIQIALIDLLRHLDIVPDYIVGHSIGELSCAYADGCLTLEETITCAYWRGICVEYLLKKSEGAMAAIGCSWQKATELCSKLAPDRVWPACHNGEDSVTVSGSKTDIETFLENLHRNNKDIYAIKVDSSCVAFHCPRVASIRAKLLCIMKSVFGSQERKRSSRWLSSTYNSSETDQRFTAEYLVDNLILPVRFHAALQQVPSESIFLEVGPHHLLQAIVKANCVGTVPIKYVPSLSRKNDNVLSVLQMIGLLYQNGLNPRSELLYPKVQYPVPQNTASLHSFIHWKHNRHFTVTQYPEFFNPTINKLSKGVHLQDSHNKYLQDHCIDGRVLYPATGYLYLVWEYMAKLLKVELEQLPIIFEDVSLHRATIMPQIGVSIFDVYILNGTGCFTILEGGMVTTTGKVRVPQVDNNFLQHQSLLDDARSFKTMPTQMEMITKDIYKEFRLRGYDYGPEFQTISQIEQVNKTISAKVMFKNWVTFVDGLIQMGVLGLPSRGLYLPVRINSLRCDPKKLFPNSDNVDNVCHLDAFFDGDLNIGVAPGIEYEGIKANLAPRNINQTPVVETFEFVANNELNLPYICSQGMSEQHNQMITSQINAYHNTCLQMLSSSELDQDKLKQFESKYEAELSPAVLMKLLSNITDWSTVDEKMLESLEEDLLFRTYENERFLRTQLETFCENMLVTNLQVLEVGQSPATMSKNIYSWLLMSSFKITFTYELLHSALDQFKSISFDSISAQHDWIAEKSKLPTDLVNIDLIVYKDSSTFPLLAKHKIHFPSLLESIWNALTEKGFCLIILRDFPFEIEKKFAQLMNRNLSCDDVSRVSEFKEALAKSSFSLVGRKSDVFGVNAFFVRKISQNIQIEKQHFLSITNDVKQWFEPLKVKLAELATNENAKESQYQENVWLLANEATTGVIGFISCLHKEPFGSHVRCILNCTGQESIDVNSFEIANIIKLDMFTNVLGQNGMLGSYKHFTLSTQINEPIPKEHCFLNVTSRGNLSSLRWFESSHKYWPQNRKSGQTLCTVYYAALNFRDIMLATGKLPPDALPDDMGLNDCILGLEFAGRDEDGNRVMGIVLSKALATTVVMQNRTFLWPIPAQWSMEEAATVPVAYATAYYALLIRGKLQRNEKVLIHSGSGAVGQATIAICLSYDCQLFITVGSDAKRDILMRLFPQLKITQFFNSRNIDFARQILQETDGMGVDLILNSLAEEKLQASVSCLADFGRFLEIGKFDLSQNNKFDTSLIMSKTFHSILLDNLFNFGSNVPRIIDHHRDLIWKMMKEGIKNGVVRPLERTIFTLDKCEDAFRYMATGMHVGKVVIPIREEEKLSVSESSGIIETKLKIPAIPRTMFRSDKSYIITGGLGGFGLELVNWMFERDARRFVITSRTGVKDFYQKTRLDLLNRQGAIVTLFIRDASQEEIAEELVNKAEAIGPLGGVFHLAMVLSDGLYENQTTESFETVVKPKATTFAHLDKITRAKCPHVDYFVAFSSIACGMGNPGQSNYDFANSAMERICEQRRRDGKHGLAIQWGPVGDVGYIINNIRGNDVVIFNTLPQRIPSCLATLDQLLQTPYSVCSSLIRVDCKSKMIYGKTSLIQSVAHILGIKDYEKLDKAMTLSELGMDSLMGVEVKQTIERDYDVILSAKDIRDLTIGKIIEIGSGQTKQNLNETNTSILEKGKAIDEQLVPLDPICYLNDIVNGDPIIFLPQIDATYEQILPIAAKLNRPVIGLNWTKDCAQLTTVSMVATHYIQLIEQTLPNLQSNYDLVGYSFGGIIAIEMGILLHRRQSMGRLGAYRKLIILDSSPKQFKMFTDEVLQRFNVQDKFTDQVFVATILMFLMTKLNIDLVKVNESLIALDSSAKRIEFVRYLFKQHLGVEIQAQTLQFLIETNYNKMRMINLYECADKSLPGDLMLIRASEYLVKENKEIIRDDYWLTEIISGQCHTHVLNGDHSTFITDNYSQITEIIRKYLEN